MVSNKLKNYGIVMKIFNNRRKNASGEASLRKFYGSSRMQLCQLYKLKQHSKVNVFDRFMYMFPGPRMSTERRHYDLDLDKQVEISDINILQQPKLSIDNSESGSPADSPSLFAQKESNLIKILSNIKMFLLLNFEE